jgi:hypothetical protein
MRNTLLYIHPTEAMNEKLRSYACAVQRFLFALNCIYIGGKTTKNKIAAKCRRSCVFGSSIEGPVCLAPL